ncbi:SDR family NAD(P)-dependent oxidoreductase, partial [Streptomyces sp. NPDC058646]|uniref:SDR family NAD(P)-dependent oxidoreductase n=1 Tax=Streptomyces sp. NPDC058646 TaxID=3346574 RepID=UPI00365C25C6
RFTDALHTLHTHGVTTYTELGPDTTLTTLTHNTHDDTTAVSLLRPGRPESETLALAIGALHNRGVRVDWEAYFAPMGARLVNLPTYAFQHERYWLEAAAPGGVAGAAAIGHPLVGSAVELADGDQTLFTGRISVSTHPWLAEHTVVDAPVLPAAALAELAVRAGDELDATVVDELTLHTPLVLAPHSPLQLQLTVASPDHTHGRSFTLYARPDGEGSRWAAYATGTLRSDASHTTAPEPLTGRATTVELPEELAGDAARYGLHPALLDAAVTSLAGLAGTPEPGTVRVPAVWEGVRLHATGATSVQVRAVLLDGEAGGDPDGDAYACSVQLSDETGQPVLTVERLVFRDVAETEFAATGSGVQPLYRLDWSAAGFEEPDIPFRWGVLGAFGDTVAEGLLFSEVAELGDAVAAGAPLDAVLAWAGPVPGTADPAAEGMAAAVHDRTSRMLALVQQWTADERLADTPLVVLTRGAVTTGIEDVVDLPAAAVWGLLRSAQTEANGRIVLIDLEDVAGGGGHTVPDGLLAAVLASGEPQAAIRNDKVRLPRLQRSSASAASTNAESALSWDPDGTVLITGGTGALGGLAARLLVSEHRVRHLLLVSRRGADAPGAGELRAELAELGAAVTFAACDVSDRDALAAVLAGIPAERPLIGIVHTAGVMNNGLVSDLTPERLGAVLAPKADAAWHLHELTRHLDLSAFVLFSSSVAVIGNPGQADYAAANAFLDGLAGHRAARGHAATSISWGLWDLTRGINAGLGQANLARFAREGFRPIPAAEGTALLHSALVDGEAHLVAVPVDLAAMRTHGRIPSVFHGLVSVPNRRSAQSGAGADGADAAQALARRLAGLPDAERARTVLDLVRAEIATVLGHARADMVDAERPFQKLGFDSMTAVDLSKRLTAETGVRLPSTLVFDHPNPTALSAYLLSRIPLSDGGAAAGGMPGTPLAELDRLEAALAADPAAGNEHTRAELSERLQSLLSRLSPAGGPADGSPELVDALGSASASEIFDFIDTQLGRSAH